MTTDIKSRLAVTGEPLPEASIARIAAAIDAHPEGRDAATLAAAIAGATGADLALLAIEPDLPVVIPGFDWRRVRRETEALLTETKDSIAPQARTMIDTDLSIARGIERAVLRGERDLLVIGSSHRGPDGTVRIGRHARQLLHLLPCPLAVAVRGLSTQTPLQLRRIAVGYDGGPEARGALATAASIASGSGAEVTVIGIADDRLPSLGWRDAWAAAIEPSWDELMDREVDSLTGICDDAAGQVARRAQIAVERGRPASVLSTLSGEFDLLAIGSRRWGPAARVLLGATGEALMHSARCSMMVVPRPNTTS